MKKFIVETFTLVLFKTVHTLSELNDKELAKIDERTDGNVEVIEVKLNNRKTKKIGDKKEKNLNEIKTHAGIGDKISEKIVSANKKEKSDNFPI